MEGGKRALVQVAKQIEELAENNPCGMEDSMLLNIANSIKSMISTKVRQELSREASARYLGLSLRTFCRYVENGRIPKGHRSGHKELSWYIDELDAIKLNKSTSEK
jgi:predicted DNA-binding transcriptional regulator AlpA